MTSAAETLQKRLIAMIRETPVPVPLTLMGWRLEVGRGLDMGVMLHARMREDAFGYSMPLAVEDEASWTDDAIQKAIDWHLENACAWVRETMDVRWMTSDMPGASCDAAEDSGHERLQ